jgi:hypothetical protein
MPAQAAWESRPFLVLHVVCFLQISDSVNRRRGSPRSPGQALNPKQR